VPGDGRAVLVLDENVKGKVQHGERDGPEHGLEDALGAGRDGGSPLVLVLVAIVAAGVLAAILAVGAAPLPGQLPLAPRGLLKEVALAGKVEQRLLRGGAAVGLPQLDVAGGRDDLALPGHWGRGRGRGCER